MTKHSHRFAETFDGFSGYGLDRQSNENTVHLYLQKFSDDDLMKTLSPSPLPSPSRGEGTWLPRSKLRESSVGWKRMTGDDLAEVFAITSKMLREYLAEPEHHQLFLKEEER